MILIKIAWRNLWRSKRRTQLTMGAMIFACALLVFLLGYYEGFLWGLINNATEKENGHIVIAGENYISNPTLYNTISEQGARQIPEELAGKIRGACPRMSVFGLLSFGTDSNNKTHPAEILGVDFRAELKLSRLGRNVVAGEFLSGADYEIIMGKGLARKLGATVGDEIIVLSTGADGAMVSEILILKGIIDTGDNMRDSALALMNLAEVQYLFRLENQLHSLRVFVNQPLEAENIATELAEHFPGHEITPWTEVFPLISQLLNIWLGMQLFTMAIYYSALIMITFNTMYMAFLERIREFAVMRSIGLTKARLAGLIVSESLFMSTISGVFGTLAGTSLNLYFYYYPFDLTRWIGKMDYAGTSIEAVLFCVPGWTASLLPLLTMILLGLTVAIFPSWKLYRLRPIEALREV